MLHVSLYAFCVFVAQEWSLLEAHNRTQQLWQEYEQQQPDVAKQGLSVSNLTYAMSLVGVTMRYTVLVVS